MIRIVEILIPPEVEEKLWSKHGITQWDVQQAVFHPESEARWDLDDEHGGRVVVRGWTAETQPRLVFIALRPLDLDRGIWACITAFVPDDKDYGAHEGRTDDGHP